jgi:hypothetical protein
MNAFKQARRYVQENRGSASALGLTRLTEALNRETEFSLAVLYEMDADAFDIALELLRDWRLDRYYAARIRLFDSLLDMADTHTSETSRTTRASAQVPASMS